MAMTPCNSKTSKLGRKASSPTEFLNIRSSLKGLSYHNDKVRIMNLESNIGSWPGKYFSIFFRHYPLQKRS